MWKELRKSLNTNISYIIETLNYSFNPLLVKNNFPRSLYPLLYHETDCYIFATTTQRLSRGAFALFEVIRRKSQAKCQMANNKHFLLFTATVVCCGERS